MGQSSSTSSSDPAEIRRPLWRAWEWRAAALAVLGSWLAVALGGPIGSVVNRYLGRAISGALRDRIDDVPALVSRSLREVALLLTAAAALALVTAVASGFFHRRRWNPLLALSCSVLTAFASINVFFALASSTAVFWLTLFAAGPNLKQPAFHIERLLLAQSAAKRKVVILGSSQGHAQIRASQLDAACGPDARFANLSYAGSTGFDFVLIERHFRSLHPSLVIVYLSPQNFYFGRSTGRMLPFLEPDTLLDGYRWGLFDVEADDGLWYGTLGMLSPAFRVRRALADALFGESTADGDDEGNAGGAATPGDRLSRRAQQYRVSSDSAFQLRAFREFLGRVTSNGSAVALLWGQVHPDLSARISADVHRDFSSHMEQFASLPSVRVLREGLPLHEAADYARGDFMHVKPQVRVVYTKALAGSLRHEFGLCQSQRAGVDSDEPQ